MNTKNKKVLFKKEILEDGGRFYKKRNIAIMIESKKCSGLFEGQSENVSYVFPVPSQFQNLFQVA